MELPEVIQNVVDQFTKLPGIGSKTAMRYALTMANWDHSSLQAFGQSISELISLKKCKSCGLYSDEDLCVVCSDSSRGENKIICVVETISDCMAIERSGQYRGVYYILGGVLNPLLGIGPDEIGIPKLIDRIQNEKIAEIILAINPSVEGDATCSFIKQQLGQDLLVERIGFGIPMGGSLEYLDSMTISKALENKKKM